MDKKFKLNNKAIYEINNYIKCKRYLLKKKGINQRRRNTTSVLIQNLTQRTRTIIKRETIKKRTRMDTTTI